MPTFMTYIVLTIIGTISTIICKKFKHHVYFNFKCRLKTHYKSTNVYVLDTVVYRQSVTMLCNNKYIYL